MKSRFWILVVALIFVAVVIAAAASKGGNNSSSVTQQRPDPTLQFTVQSDTIGNDYILVTNEATGARITITQNMLPFTANFAKGDVLTFKVIAREGYIFNAWLINDGTWESSNPLSLRPTGDFIMKAYFLAIAETS
jgi:hypothetical protein